MSRGTRVDAELGFGVDFRLVGSVSLFGELNMGIGQWVSEPPSVLPVQLSTSSEGFSDARVGLKIGL